MRVTTFLLPVLAFVVGSFSASCGSSGSGKVPPTVTGSGGDGTSAASVGGTTNLGAAGDLVGAGGIAQNSDGGSSAVSNSGGASMATGGFSASGGTLHSGGTVPSGGNESTSSGGRIDGSGGTGSGGAGRTGSGGRNSATGGRNGGSGGRNTGSGGASVASGGTNTGGGTSEASGGTSERGAECTPPTVYENLFVTVSGHTQEETDAKIAAAWNQLYNPSNANTVYYDGPGADESYVKDTGNNDVRTEGMSYGMMTAVQLDKQTEFDRLWAWVKNHMAQGTGQIAWQCTTSGSKMSTGCAPDGEEYFATALVFAHYRWGDSSGRFNYGEEAQWVLDLLRTEEFNSQYHIVQFYVGSGNTDASYILPAFYQAWACFDTANAEYWNAAVTAGREFFHVAADSNGVIGDHQSFTGQTQQGAGSDAKRCVANIMMDHNFFAADPWQTETYAPAFASYMTSHSDGSAAQLSCNALLGFGLPASTGKPFVDKLWSAAIPTGNWRYYDGTLYMLGLLHVSGTFKLWY